ncbi:hypothetical protein ABVK25_006292 [Lepraria finkii]|uniref:Uncharacterized protein n=1 Tax=Lepraria finkii TaxID=1340010 RepID=A0ABR4B8V7_9LECA
MVASQSKAKTIILAPCGSGLTEPKGKPRSKDSTIEEEQNGRALIAPVRKDRDKFRERTVLEKDSSVKDQSSKLTTYESENLKTEVSGVMELIDSFRCSDYPVQDEDITKALQLTRSCTILEVRDESGKTALRWAPIQCTHTFVDGNNEVIIDVIRELLERGAEVDARDHGLATPLHWVWYGRIAGENTSALAVVCLLLEYNADADAKSSMGRTPLYQFAARKHEMYC